MIKKPCLKCEGTGILQHYLHIKNGTCFTCKGEGYFLLSETQYKKQLEDAEQEKKRYNEYLKQEQQFEDERKKEAERLEEQKERNIQRYQEKLKYYGTTGDKIKLTLTYKDRKIINSKWGSSNLYILTYNNHTFTFFTKDIFFVIGDQYEIEATIKAHKEINGYKQTELKNVKVLNHINLDELTDDEIDALPI